jgi:hypothetical protein
MRHLALVFAALAVAAIPSVASADTTPPALPYVVAARVNVTSSHNVNLTPATFGCTGTQVFYAKDFLVHAFNPNPLTWELDVYVTQEHQGSIPVMAQYYFRGGVTGAASFSLPSVGAPISGLSWVKDSGGAGTTALDITVWGYCAAPTVVH